MKFGKSLEREVQELPTEWQPYLVHYKELKKCINKIVTELNAADSLVRLESGNLSIRLTDGSLASPRQVTYEFSGNGNELHPTLHITLLDSGESSTSNTDNDEDEEEHGGTIKIEDHIQIITTNKKDSHSVDELVAIEVKPLSDITVDVLNSQDLSIPPLLPESISNRITTEDSDIMSTVEECYPWPQRATVTIVNNNTNLAEQHMISYELQADTEFFRQLTGTLSQINTFHLDAQANYNNRIQQITSLLAKGASPYGKDLYIWREIIELYVKAEIWTVEMAMSRKETSATAARNKLNCFLREEERLGLRQKLRLATSRQTMNEFVQLLDELCNVRHMQSLNQLAVTKILKKHDKRTRLSARSYYPVFMSNDPFFTLNLSQNIALAICDRFTAIVPQLDDYLCPICYELCWKPIRLMCRHIFCLRCLIKAQRSDMQNCPVCRHPKAVLDAYADQLDIPLMNMLALYFPRELKQKKKNINREVGLEEARMISGVDWRTPEERGETPTRATRPFTGANRDSSSKYDCILM